MCSVHPVFYVSMLEHATSNTFSERIQPAPAPVIIDGKPEYEISRIVDSKIDCQQACKLLYKVIWLGYEDTGDESECIPTSKLTHAMDLVSDFHTTYPTKPGPLLLFWTCCCICSLALCIYNGDFPSLISLVYSVCLFSLTLSFRTLFGVFSQTSFYFNSCFSYSHMYFTENKNINKKSIKKQNQNTNRRRMTEFPPPDFSWGHPWTLPLHLHSPFCSLLPSPISAPS